RGARAVAVVVDAHPVDDLVLGGEEHGAEVAPVHRGAVGDVGLGRVRAAGARGEVAVARLEDRAVGQRPDLQVLGAVLAAAEELVTTHVDGGVPVVRDLDVLVGGALRTAAGELGDAQPVVDGGDVVRGDVRGADGPRRDDPVP